MIRPQAASVSSLPGTSRLARNDESIVPASTHNTHSSRRKSACTTSVPTSLYIFVILLISQPFGVCRVLYENVRMYWSDCEVEVATTIMMNNHHNHRLPHPRIVEPERIDMDVPRETSTTISIQHH